MMKNKSYIGISLVILVFGIIFVPKIIDRIKDGSVVQGDRIDAVSNNRSKNIDTGLVKIGPEPTYSLTNQDGKTITNKEYAGKVHVVEFFFSTCPSICPIMNQNMLIIEKEFMGNPNFGIVSITINPETDTQQVLKQHAKDLGVTSSNWNFLTGKKDYIYNIANKGFNLYAGQNTKVDGGFEHSGYFALVDKKGNIRSRKDANGNPVIYYNGLEKEDVKAIMTDIKKLLNE
ncbi:SCO family protein [Flavobacterium sp.]